MCRLSMSLSDVNKEICLNMADDVGEDRGGEEARVVTAMGKGNVGKREGRKDGRVTTTPPYKGKRLRIPAELKPMIWANFPTA